MAHHDTQKDFDDCIKACQEALRACHECAHADIQEANQNMQTCSLMNLDCADMCEATIKALARRSPHHGDFCAVCAHLCRACAEECGRHQHEHCIRCKAACERCAQACQVHASERHTS